MLSTVHEDLSVTVDVRLEQEKDVRRRLHDSPRIWSDSRPAGRQTVRLRIVLRLTSFQYSFRFGQYRNRLARSKTLGKIPDTAAPVPHSRQIGRRRCRTVRAPRPGRQRLRGERQCDREDRGAQRRCSHVKPSCAAHRTNSGLLWPLRLRRRTVQFQRHRASDAARTRSESGYLSPSRRSSNGRMIFMLNRLAGGVNWQVPTFGSTGTSGLRPFDNGGGSAWSIAGGRVSTNEFLLDGVPNSTRGRYNFGPPVDAVEEFRIQTNTYDAQYGRTGGGVVNMTLKSGGNTFHGQAWNFFKNDALNANNTLNNSQGQPKPPYVANQYGITMRGPVVHGRTFFMGTFEGLRERVPFPFTISVPTEAERRGDFSRSSIDQPTPLVI